jgi:hypothetical protein
VQIKGTAFLSKKQQIIRMYDEQRWRAFLAHLVREVPFFDVPVLATTLIPAETFLAFQDHMLAWFFDDDVEAYWGIGARSAEWALGSDGPYGHFIASRDIRGFLARFPALWSTYFTASTVSVSMVGDVIEVRTSGLPVWHGYFEYMVMGYFKRALELLGASVTARRLSPAQSRDFRYQFVLAK